MTKNLDQLLPMSSDCCVTYVPGLNRLKPKAQGPRPSVS
jgi:hypothetical protein